MNDQPSEALVQFYEPTPDTPQPDPEDSDKVKKEWAKIRRLENKLGAANKAQQAMQGRIND